jgi:cytidyltransferase-like protein
MTVHQHVLAIGVFDLFHIGHLRYLQFARTKGLKLTVGVTPDECVWITKQKLPVISQDHRMEIIRGLGWVDTVKLMPTSTENTLASAIWIPEWGVDHVVVGGAWVQNPRWIRLIPLLAKNQISVSFAPHTEGISSSKIQDLIQYASNIRQSC